MMREQEQRIEIIFPAYSETAVLKAVRASHPYEEIAYDVLTMDNQWQNTGSGMIGFLPQPLSQNDFLAHVKKSLQAEVIRYTATPGKNIEKVAICGGSGSFLLKEAIANGADALVTADFKYHQFFDSEGKILIADIGHFESEQFTIDLLVDKLKDIITTFARRKTEIKKKPITYYT